MPLLGSAAMLLSFEVADEATGEHDEWHTREHLPERLSIPGFLRGSRWVTPDGPRRYLVLYEVAQLATLSSAAYLERLEHPSPWTARMMTRYRAMTRGFCAVTGSVGAGLGGACLLLRFAPAPEAAASLRVWLCRQALPDLCARRGIGSAHLLEGAATPTMTAEQRIRGADAGIDWALVVTGYDEPVLAGSPLTEPLRTQLAANGAVGISNASYRMGYSLARGELGG